MTRLMLVCLRCRSIFLRDVQRCGLDGSDLVEQEEDPLVGATIDRYEILERIGHGAMAAVYRARHVVLERELALKVLLGDYGSQQVIADRFCREAKAASRMRHPNIVSVTDFGTSAEGLPFMVMEFVKGQTLAEVIAEEAPFGPQRAASYAVQIARGLEEAHRNGLVHRDVKPLNMMITREGGREIVKILDFGVVRVMDAEVSSRLTRTGAVLGTPTYMAPEQALQPTVGPSADLYSLGVVLYEMLAGVPPFVDPKAAQIVVQHMTAPPPPLRPSAGLEDIAHQLLAKAPEDRPASAAAVVSALEGFLGREATEPRDRRGPAGIADDLRLSSAIRPSLMDDALSDSGVDVDSSDLTKMHDPTSVFAAGSSVTTHDEILLRESPDRTKTRLIRPRGRTDSIPEVSADDFEALPSVTDPHADLAPEATVFETRTAYTEVGPIRYDSSTPSSFGGEDRTTLDTNMFRHSGGFESAITDEHNIPVLKRPDSIEPTRVSRNSDLTPIEDPSDLQIGSWPPRRSGTDPQGALHLRFAADNLRLSSVAEPQPLAPSTGPRVPLLPDRTNPVWLWVLAVALVVMGASALLVALLN